MPSTLTESVGTRLRPAVIAELRNAASIDGVTVSTFIAKLVRVEMMHRREIR
jgi:hypothetical protein